MIEAARLQFGAKTQEWPDGFCLVPIKSLSPELEQCLIDCDVHVSRRGSENNEASKSLVLVTPESDQERLIHALLQVQLNEGIDQPEVAVDQSDDSDEEDNNEEFRQFPLGTRSTVLMFAAALGDSRLLETLLKNGADPNKRDPRGNTALMIAARNGHLNIVRTLIHHPRTQVNLKNCKGKSALFYAAAQGRLDVFSLLLVFGGEMLDRERPSDWDKHPLLVAANNGHYGICKRIIETGMDVDFQDQDEHHTALQHAASNGHIECCKLLIDAGANVNHVNANGHSILHTAIRYGHIDVFELLIARGASLKYEEDSPSLLTTAVDCERESFVKRLIELKVDVNFIDNGTTALSISSKIPSNDRAKKIVTLLLGAGADPDIPDEGGFNTLVHAASRGNIALMSLLIKHGAKIRSKHHFGYLALCQAAKFGQLEAIRFLLASGAPTYVPRWQLLDAPTPLLVSFINSGKILEVQARDGVLNHLIQNGASLREVDASGQDALMYAVARADPHLVVQLLKAGATVGQANGNGLNALEMAVELAERALGAELPSGSRNGVAINLLLTVLEGVKRQTDYFPIISTALQKAKRTVTRELLLQRRLIPSPDFSIRYTILNWTQAHVRPILKSACITSTKDWNRSEIEIQLAIAGTPVPTINVYCDYVDAFPAMKFQLFGPANARDINQGYWEEFFGGIDATMEKMLVVENEIDRSYEGLGWEGVRPFLGKYAQDKIARAVTSGTTAEQQRQTRFAELFDHCLQSTMASQAAQGLQLLTLPAPGLIAGDLMRQWIYAALAEYIEKAWRAAWLATIKPEQEATEFAFTVDEYAAIGAASFQDIVMPMRTPTISEQQSSKLLEAFKKALRPSYRDLLKLPNASPKEAALYADLMERQLHMLMQFVNDTTEASVPATTSGSM